LRAFLALPQNPQHFPLDLFIKVKTIENGIWQAIIIYCRFTPKIAPGGLYAF